MLCHITYSKPSVEMTVISWVTDETNDALRSLNLLRKLLGYAASLCAVQLLPVLIAGSFRLPIDHVKQVTLTTTAESLSIFILFKIYLSYLKYIYLI